MCDVTPHKIESTNEKSDYDNDEALSQDHSFGEGALDLWKRRSANLHLDYSIAGWAFLVAPEVKNC